MLQERVIQRETFKATGSDMGYDRVVRSLARGEIDARVLNAALVILERVKEERQRMIDKKPLTPESEQAMEWLADTVGALCFLGKEFNKETIQEFQETLSSLKEGKIPPGEKIAGIRAFFRALNKKFLNQPFQSFP